MMKKILFLLFLMIGGALLNCNNVFAQKDGVSITSASMVQEGDKINISFNVKNDTAVIKTDLKYAISLEKVIRDKDGLVESSSVDKVYLPQEDLLAVGEQVTHNFAYAVPTVLSGEYRIVIYVENSSGAVESLRSIDRVNLNNDEKESIIIDKHSCQIHVAEGEGDVSYGVAQGVDILPEESIIMFCDIVNNYNEEKTVLVKHDFLSRGMEKIKSKGTKNSNEPIKLGAKERKRVLIDVPHLIKPQAYNTKIVLEETDTKKVSNSVVVHYVINGPSGTIQKVDIDAKGINKEGKLRVSIDFTGRADYFFGSRELQKNPEGLNKFKEQYKLKLKVTDGKNVCAEGEKSMIVKTTKNKAEVDLQFKDNCSGTELQVNLLDDQGNILDSKQLKTDFNKINTKKENKNNFGGKWAGIVLGIIVLIIGLGLFIYKKANKSTFIALLMLGGGLIFWGMNITYASYTLKVPPFERAETRWGDMDLPLIIEVNGDCENSKIDFTATVLTCANTPQSRMEIKYRPEGGAKTMVKTAYSHCNKEIKDHNYKNKNKCEDDGHEWKVGTDGEGACWKTFNDEELRRKCPGGIEASDISSFSYENIANTMGTHKGTVYARYFPGARSDKDRGEEGSIDIEYDVICAGKCSSEFNGQTVDNLTGNEALCSTGTIQGFQTTDTPGWKWQCNNSGKLSDWCSANKTCGQCPTGNVGALCGVDSGVVFNCASGSILSSDPERSNIGEVYTWTWECERNSCKKECNTKLDLTEITLKVEGVPNSDVQDVPTITVNQASELDEKFTLKYTTPKKEIGANCILTGKIGEDKISGFPKTVTSDGNVEVTATKTGKYDFKLDCKCAQGDLGDINVTRKKTVNVLCDANPSAWSACSSSCQGTKTKEITDPLTCERKTKTETCGDPSCEGGTIEK